MKLTGFLVVAAFAVALVAGEQPCAQGNEVAEHANNGTRDAGL